MSKQNYINGQWVEGAGATPNVNPSNTKDVIGEYAQADKAQRVLGWKPQYMDIGPMVETAAKWFIETDSPVDV